jgi:hypothetical protein
MSKSTRHATRVTPDTVDMRITKREFKDGAPSAETVAKVYDTPDRYPLVPSPKLA